MTERQSTATDRLVEEIADGCTQWPQHHNEGARSIIASIRPVHGRANRQRPCATADGWTDQYPSVIAALANVEAKTAYLDGEL